MDINIASLPTMVHNRTDTPQAPAKEPVVGEVELKDRSIASVAEQVSEQKTSDNEQDPSKLTQVATELSDMMSMMRKGLSFKVDENSGQAVVTVLDKDTGDVIRQMPSEEALALAEKLSEVTGLLMKTEA
ncbi:flagellar protein FlaG [Shewanella xiamenensis]|uniref:flagellar protein FlaG n=1 Tax=Shewanella xiamenensis TaxID=332186 RepID=UPI001667C0ED|nr:flagellar protein FlaG [Shewanella xiamenensis]MCL1071944.1 flagellar protein FlaG [Shewanella xiamenensis]WHF56881.1 flagellar protein FlaG [Shewanella xiamenensis]GGM97523.1 flagella locus protein FlaG [Shewanella xiamenensis]